MRARLVLAALVLTAAGFGTATLVSAADKLPKCNQVDCRGLGCPADVLCVSGAHVKTCAAVCGGH